MFLREVGKDYGAFYLNLELMCLFKNYVILLSSVGFVLPFSFKEICVC